MMVANIASVPPRPSRVTAGKAGDNDGGRDAGQEHQNARQRFEQREVFQIALMSGV